MSAGPSSTGLRVLVVDDERISRQTTAQQLAHAGYAAVAAQDGRAGLELLDAEHFDVVLTDLRMPGMDGLEVLGAIKQRSPETEVIIMTAYGSVETAVAAMQAGAADYLTKPFRFVELDIRLRRLAELRESRDEVSRLRTLLDDTTMHGLVGRCPGIVRVCGRIRLFANNAVPVLVTGETGTGKEVVARVLHQVGPRREHPFVALGCGTIPRDLAEAQLFGHEKGAFTGAAQRRKGCFERADRGTLLLDDLDDLPLDLQVKLLRVLQDGVVVRLGGEAPIATDVRVIATTKIDLAQAVEAGTFRDDLYYRLRGFEISLPPLRDRGDDVLLLAHHFLRTQVSRSDGEGPKTIDHEAMALLRSYAWPGNVRELRRVMETAAVLCEGDRIGPSVLPEALTQPAPDDALFVLNLDGRPAVQLPQLVHRFEDEVIRWAMQRAGGSQTRAAEILGLPRTSLQSKLARTRHGDER